MFKITAIFLALTIALQSFNLKPVDVLNLPNLFGHALSHLNTGDSFLEFMAMHYGNKYELHINKHKEHKNLPFNHKKSDSITTSVFFFESVIFSIKQKVCSFFQFALHYYIEPFSYLLSYTFFQPPK